MPDEVDEPLIEIVLDVTDQRFRKIVATRSNYTVEKVSEGRFIIRKGSSTYFVGMEKSRTISASCNCPDWKFHSRKMKVPCKHIWLAAEAEDLVTFPSVDQLPGPEEGPDQDDTGEGNGKSNGTEKKDEDPEVEEIDIPLD